jgi:Zn-dependent peptidase ImmA (M78 family)
MPLKNKEIGAFLLKLNDSKYVVLNTSKSCANNNFALGHELYHTLIQQDDEYNSAEVYMENYDDNPVEMKANAFSGSIIMPKNDFILTSTLLNKLPSDGVSNIHKYASDLLNILTLMNNYKTTYMSVVIRCYECGVFDKNDEEKMTFLLAQNDEKAIKKIFDKVSSRIPVSVQMEASYIDDFEMLYEEAKTEGQKSFELGWITEEDLKYRLDGLKSAYQQVVEVQ